MTLIRRLAYLAVITGVIVIGAASAVRSALAAGPWYVTATGNDANACTSPAVPCGSLNSAIARAAAGDQIYVGVGVYTSLGNEVVLLDKTIHLSGGWNNAFTSQTGVSTVDGQLTRRGLTVNNGVVATLKRFVIQNGRAPQGGGIYNAGALTLTACAIQFNTAPDGGITDIGSGGGVFNTGSITVLNSRISDNYSSANLGGAGIYSTGSVTVRNSVIARNAAASRGGGLSGLAGSIVLVNTFVHQNSAYYGGGLYMYSGTGVGIYNSTIVENHAEWFGGGLVGDYAGGSLFNSIVYGNTAPNNPDCYWPWGGNGYNIIGVACAFAYVPPGGFGPDPRLMHVGETYLLLPDSPAIDGGFPLGCADPDGGWLTTDQRGTVRTLDGNADGPIMCDLGAYEFDPAHPTGLLRLPFLIR